MKIEDLRMSNEQHSLEWFKARMGIITGSCVGNLMGKGKGSKRWSEGAITYMLGKSAEATEVPEDITSDMTMYGKFADYVQARQVKTKAMQKGEEQEQDARKYFSLYIQEMLDGVEVVEVGSIAHPEYPYADSPDGVIVHKGTGEIAACCEFKCTEDTNFMRYKIFVRENKNGDAGAALKRINKVYYYQCQAHMDVTGTDICYFCFYNKDTKTFMGIVTIKRNQKDIDEMHQTILEAHEVIQGGCESLYVEED